VSQEFFDPQLLSISPKIEDERLDGRTEAEDVRTILELIHTLTLEASEQLDAYQERHSGL
jgi:hypothetical protein